MGWSTKQVSSDDGSDWNQSLLQAQRQLPMKRQQQQHQSMTSDEQMKCPRCGSTNTKFCYYNNYKKSQPRHFCKTCKRHWTKGGTLRNVPVGGGRKNKRPRMKTSPSADITNTTSMTSVAMSDTSSGSDRINQHKHKHKQLIFPQPSLLLQPTFGDISSTVDHSVLQELDEQFPWSCSSPFEVSSWQHPILTGTETIPMSLTCDQPWTFSSDCSETMGNNMNWDELDKFVPANLNFPWDYLDIKLP